MDEPLSNLDAKLRVSMRAELRHLHYELGTTTVYVTHDQIEAMTLATRVAVMNKGEVVQLGTPQEIYQDPQSLFVASFIGSPPMNFLHGSLKSRVLSGTNYAVAKIKSRFEGPAILGIRPEHVKIVDASRADITAPIYTVEYTGQSAIVTVIHDGAHFSAVTAPGTQLQIGEKIGFKLDANEYFLFDGVTTLRIRD
jgi:multiple sugar transport system ATP-binding protein